MKTRFCVAAAVLASVASVSAQTVVPNHLASAEGNSNFFLFVASGSRTYQEIIAASQLTSLVGTNLTGLQFRLDSAATGAWPTASGSLSDFTVNIGPGVTPAAQSLTFASNFTSTPTTVRTGVLNMNAGDYTFGGSPNGWAPVITFNSGYAYGGGDLTVEFRFTGFAGQAQPSLDAASGDTGQGTNYVAEFQTGNTATTGIALNGRFVVTQFVTSAVPEPTSMAALGLGVIALVKRRRLRKQG